MSLPETLFIIGCILVFLIFKKQREEKTMLNEKEVEVLVVGGKRKGLQVFYDKAIERVVIEKSDKVIFNGSKLDGAIFIISYKKP